MEWKLIDPVLPISRFGPCPEGRSGGSAPAAGGARRRSCSGAWQAIHNRFVQWHNTDVFDVLLGGMITEAARREQVDMSLLGGDFATANAHHDAVGIQVDRDGLATIEEVARKRRAARRTDQQGSCRRRPQLPPSGVSRECRAGRR
jgi:hypothetical protein